MDPWIVLLLLLSLPWWIGDVVMAVLFALSLFLVLLACLAGGARALVLALFPRRP